jgi:hypothetical protein
MRLPLDLILGKAPQYQPITVLQELPERLHALRIRALEYNAKIRDKSKLHYDKSHYQRVYEKGEKVLVYNLPVAGKFQARWVGPFVVHKVYDNRVSYLVGDPYNIDNRLVHVSRLAPYFTRIHGAPQPPVITQHEQQESAVSSPQEAKEAGNSVDVDAEWPIRQLIGRRRKRRQTQYLVEWEGPYAATWEPGDALPRESREAYDAYF